MQGDFIRQVGNVTIGHAGMWATDAVLQDSGPATGGYLTELGITNNGNIALGINSAVVTAPYTALTFSVTTGVGAVIGLDSYNGSGAGSLSFRVNGVLTTIQSNGHWPLFTATTQGEVPASGGSTSAFLRADGTWAIPPGGGGGGGTVTGPATSVNNDLPVFNGTTGQVIADSGIQIGRVVTGPGASNAGDIVSFGSNTGNAVVDSGVSSAFVPVMCSATGVNALVLTPLAGSAQPGAYFNYAAFRFTAPTTTTGPVTVQVGSLPALVLYNNDGNTGAGGNPISAGDLTGGILYTIAYNSALNSGSGGFQITDGPLYQINTLPHIFIQPGINNSQATIASWSVISNSTNNTSARQFQTALMFNSVTGTGQTLNTQDRVTLYAAINGTGGSGDIWAINTLVTLATDFPPTQNAQGYELDFNNLRQHYGEAAWGNGLAAPVAYGFSISGAANFRSTAAMLISGTNLSTPNTAIWNRGIVFGNNCIQQCGIQDFTNSQTAYQVFGTHNIGIDLSHGSFSIALAMPNGTAGFLSWLNAAGTNYITDYVDNNNNRTIGGGAAGVASGASFFPSANQTFTNGLFTARWSTVFAHDVNLANTGTLQWPYANNTANVVDYVDVNNNRVVGGNAVAVFIGGANGVAPVVDNAVGCGFALNRWSVIYAVNGTIQTSDPNLKTEINLLPTCRQLLNDINPRTFKWKIGGYVPEGDGHVPVPGKRLHWGFLADEVKAAMDKVGLDFGGYVKDENGTQHLRPDQLIAVLWKAVQELANDVEALKARLA